MSAIPAIARTAPAAVPATGRIDVERFGFWYGKSQALTGLPQPVAVTGGAWYTALAGADRARYGRRTRCGYVLKPGTVGIADSVLPCGVLVYVAYKDSPQILTRVIDRRPVLPGRKFDLTPKLAEELGIDGVQRIRWVYAR